MMNKKFSTGGLVLAGLAAYAYYKYNKMSMQDKDNIISSLKEKGQKLYDEYVPQNVKDIVDSQTGNTTSNPMSSSSKFGEGNSYTG